MSVGFKNLMSGLQSNFEALVEFMDNPESYISRYKISDAERMALLSRDADKLAELTGSAQLAVGALSSSHTPTCGAKVYATL